MHRVVTKIGAASLFRIMAGLALAGSGLGCRRSAPETEAPSAPAGREASAAVQAAVAPPSASAGREASAAVQAAAPAAAPAGLPAAPPAGATGVSPAPAAAEAPAPAADAPGRTIAPSVADLRRAFTTYDQQFRREDPVCARLAAGIAEMQQAIASNEAAILQRLQSDPEWTRLRGELVEFQRAEDARRREAMLRRRGAGVTNNAQPVLLVPRQPPRGPGSGEVQP
jgi:hypothetical protein